MCSHQPLGLSLGGSQDWNSWHHKSRVWCSDEALHGELIYELLNCDSSVFEFTANIWRTPWNCSFQGRGGGGVVCASQQQVQSEGQVTAGHREESGSRLDRIISKLLQEKLKQTREITFPGKMLWMLHAENFTWKLLKSSWKYSIAKLLTGVQIEKLKEAKKLNFAEENSEKAKI